MIYLLSQMILALAVAVVLGMALGWIIHRSRHHQHTVQLQHRLARQHSQLAQVQSDVSMLNDDYDELQRQSHDEIKALQEQTREIPELSSNLEKSQLLVRQMMQRHEAKVRDLGSENQRLKAKLDKLDTHDQVKLQVVSGIDEAKSRSSSALDATTTDKNGANASPSPHAEYVAGQQALYAAAESEDDPFDEVMEVADDLQRELDDTAARTLTDEQKSDSLDLSPRLDDAPANTVNDADAANEQQLQLDGSADAATLFEPVGQHDDLQQIFGIGPLTEKALNDLGITSYSQLAELQQCDIQRIADALEIGASRIERDNWVGNARRQLEEVLEQL